LWLLLLTMDHLLLLLLQSTWSHSTTTTGQLPYWQSTTIGLVELSTPNAHTCFPHASFLDQLGQLPPCNLRILGLPTDSLLALGSDNFERTSILTRFCFQL
jgi:hypothetical protein